MKYKILSAWLGVFALAWAHNAVSAEMPVLRHSMGRDLPILPMTIAEKEGFFAHEGVRVELVKDTARGKGGSYDQGVVAALENGGQADMTSGNAGFFIDAVLHGSDAIAVGVQTANPVYSLIVRPEIKTYADLKGKTITLTAPWDAITLTSRALLAKHGIGPKDFTFELIPYSGPRLECLQKGRCAAIVAVHPTDIEALATGGGLHRLGTTLDAGPVTFYMDIVRRQWAETHKDTIVRYLKAEADAIRFIHDPKNRGEVAKTIAELTGKMPAIVDQLTAQYQDPKLHILSEHGELDVAGFNNLLKFAKASGNYDKPFPAAEKFIDLTYVKAAGNQ